MKEAIKQLRNSLYGYFNKKETNKAVLNCLNCLKEFEKLDNKKELIKIMNKYPTFKEFQENEIIYNEIENLRINMLISIEKKYNIPVNIMDKLAYDIEFFETLEHNNSKKMFELIKNILKENFNIEIN